eukprot:408929_1
MAEANQIDDIKVENDELMMDNQQMNELQLYENRIKLIDFTRLENRVCRHYPNFKKECKLIMEEYKKYLLIKCVGKDYCYAKYSPSWHVDQVWHLHILDTIQYRKDNKILFNGDDNLFIEHDIDGDLNEKERQKRYQNTINDYVKLFKSDPVQTKFWGKPWTGR